MGRMESMGEKMRRVLLALTAVFVLVACSNGQTLQPAAESPSTVSVSPSPSPSPTPNPLDQALEEDQDLLTRVCNEFEQLVSVGWPEEVVPGMLIGEVDLKQFADAAGVTVSELRDSGLLPVPAMLAKADVRVIERLGDATQVISELVGRC